MTEADRLLGIEICKRWPVDLADVQKIIEFVRTSSSTSNQRESSRETTTSLNGAQQAGSHPHYETPLALHGAMRMRAQIALRDYRSKGMGGEHFVEIVTDALVSAVTDNSSLAFSAIAQPMKKEGA